MPEAVGPANPGQMPSPGASVADSDSHATLATRETLLRGLFPASEGSGKRQETLERVASAMDTALAWLYGEIQRAVGATGTASEGVNGIWSEGVRSGSGADSAHTSERSTASEARALLVGTLLDAFDHWHQQQKLEEEPLPMRLWLAWVGLGAALSVLSAQDASTFPSELSRRGTEAASTVTRAALTLKSAHLPVGFQAAAFHCDTRSQADFCANLWSASVYRPLQACGPREYDQALGDVAAQLLTAFTAWVTRAMRGFEVVFLSGVEHALGALVGESVHKLGVSPRLLTKFISTNVAQSGTDSGAANTAVCALVARSLCGQDRDKMMLVDSLLSPERDDVAQQMALNPLPHVRQPLAIVAAGLGIAEWSATPVEMATSSWSRVITQVFAVTRVATLPLLSPQIVTDERRLEKATQRALGELRALRADPSQRRGSKVERLYRVLECGVAETIEFFHGTVEHHLALVSALQSAFPNELFRPVLASYVSRESKKLDEQASQATELSSDSALALFKNLYDVVAPILLDLSLFSVESKEKPYRWLVRSFALLTRLEFAREAWRSPSRNRTMSTVTESIEQAIDKAPDTVLAAIFQSINASPADNVGLWLDSIVHKVVPDELDLVRGCQVLAVGLLVQRKLRALLIQATNPQLRDEAIAVVFLGINSAYEPLDTFSHRFMGMCLSHLAQFVSLYSIAPYYVQLSLPAFPSNMTQQTIAAVCGSVFGALFYSQASADDGSLPGQETAHRIMLWTMRQFLKRSAELLLADGDKGVDASPSNVNSDGLYLVGLMAEITKMGPLDVVDKAAMELEALVRDCDQFDRHHEREVSTQVKSTILTSISQNCEAEKRAWLAAWFIELETKYPSGQAHDAPGSSIASGDEDRTVSQSRL